MRALFYIITLFMMVIANISCEQISKTHKPQVFRPAIKVIVDSMAKYGQLTSSGVGYAGVRTSQWHRYKKLSSTATVEELKQLTSHSNSIVRCYAFNALVSKKDPAVFPILLAHLHDTATVSTFTGCLIDKCKVGDYFFNSVKAYDEMPKGHFSLSKQQKRIVDSLLLFDMKIDLNAKHHLIDELKPEARYYHRIREVATTENYPVAIKALARYKNRSDTNIIKKAFNNNRTEDDAIQAAIEMPDKCFYDSLVVIFEREWDKSLYDYEKWRLLYEALSKYPSEPKTILLFERTLQTKDAFRYQTLCTDLFIAASKHPNPAFEHLKKQIKLNALSMDDVRQAFSDR